jgi:hypothetical protein
MKKRMSFNQYVRYREGSFDDQFGMDDEDDGIEKLNHFILLALSDSDIRNSLYPILQQIAGQDDTGEMQALLKNIDINGLAVTAKKLLKKKHGGGLPNEKDGGEEMPNPDMIMPSKADHGHSDEGGEHSQE